MRLNGLDVDSRLIRVEGIFLWIYDSRFRAGGWDRGYRSREGGRLVFTTTGFGVCGRVSITFNASRYQSVVVW